MSIRQVLQGRSRLMQFMHFSHVDPAYSTLKEPVGVTALRLHKKEKVSSCSAAVLQQQIVGSAPNWFPGAYQWVVMCQYTHS
jgi:uncharacterized membrane protein YvbJ